MVRTRHLPSNPSEIEDLHLYTAIDIAEMVGRSLRTVRNWFKVGILPCQTVGGSRGVSGIELKKFLLGNAVRDDHVDYRGRKYPWMGYLTYLMIETKFNIAEITEQANRWRLQVPQESDLRDLWESLGNTAPKFIRDRMNTAGHKMPDLESDKFRSWVRKLGIMDLYECVDPPCLNILEDSSEKRICIEVLLCGCVIHKEICEIMKAKYDFDTTPEALNFYARYFFNTYSFNPHDRQVYITNLMDATEAMAKQKAWGNPDRAKTAMDVPIEADFESIANRLMSACYDIAMQNFGRGAEGNRVGFEASRTAAGLKGMLIKHHESQAKEVAAAKAEAAQSADNSGATFETKSEEPVDISELEQPADVAEGEEEPDFGGQAEVG